MQMLCAMYDKMHDYSTHSCLMDKNEKLMPGFMILLKISLEAIKSQKNWRREVFVKLLYIFGHYRGEWLLISRLFH